MKTRFIHSLFRESSFELSFRTVDKVIKYDEHPFYRQFTSTGLKAIDFLFLEKDHLVFVELKNYGQYVPKDDYPDAAELAETLKAKYKGSHTGVHAICSYYRQRQPGKTIFKLLDKLPLAFQQRHPWYLKSKAFFDKRIIFLLIIGFPKTELESVKSAYCKTLKEVWNNYLNIPLEIIVEDSEEDFEGLDLKILT